MAKNHSSQSCEGKASRIKYFFKNHSFSLQISISLQACPGKRRLQSHVRVSPSGRSCTWWRPSCTLSPWGTLSPMRLILRGLEHARSTDGGCWGRTIFRNLITSQVARALFQGCSTLKSSFFVLFSKIGSRGLYYQFPCCRPNAACCILPIRKDQKLGEG